MRIEPAEPVVRTLRGPDELDELHKLDAEIFADLGYPYFVLRQLYDVYRSELLVLEQEERLIGYSLAVTGGDSIGWYLALGVERSHRHRSYGRRLAETSIQRLEDHHVTEIRLTVEPENADAISLYERLGFVGQPGLEVNYLGPSRTRILMVRRPAPLKSKTPLEQRL